MSTDRQVSHTPRRCRSASPGHGGAAPRRSAAPRAPLRRGRRGAVGELRTAQVGSVMRTRSKEQPTKEVEPDLLAEVGVDVALVRAHLAGPDLGRLRPAPGGPSFGATSLGGFGPVLGAGTRSTQRCHRRTSGCALFHPGNRAPNRSFRGVRRCSSRLLSGPGGAASPPSRQDRVIAQAVAEAEQRVGGVERYVAAGWPSTAAMLEGRSNGSRPSRLAATEQHVQQGGVRLAP